MFAWDEVHDEAFEKTKAVLLSAPVLAAFSVTAPTTLHTDASRLKGLGYVITQVQEGQERLIQCGSRFLSPAETRYAVPELELLAVAWAANKARLLLQGKRDVALVVDHRPLVPIVNEYTLDKVTNPRMQRLLEKLAPFHFVARYCPGKQHFAPDALSHHPVAKPSIADLLAEAQVEDGARHAVVAAI